MKVTITAPRHGHNARIELDGVDISNATSEAVLAVRANDVTTLELTLLPEVVVVDGDLDPEQVEGLRSVQFHRKRTP